MFGRTVNSPEAPRLPVPVALVYCSESPFKEIAVVPRLKISMKSLENGAPLLPPPPYTWLITSPEEAAWTGVIARTAKKVNVRSAPKRVKKREETPLDISERFCLGSKPTGKLIFEFYRRVKLSSALCA